MTHDTSVESRDGKTSNRESAADRDLVPSPVQDISSKSKNNEETTSSASVSISVADPTPTSTDSPGEKVSHAKMSATDNPAVEVEVTESPPKTPEEACTGGVSKAVTSDEGRRKIPKELKRVISFRKKLAALLPKKKEPTPPLKIASLSTLSASTAVALSLDIEEEEDQDKPEVAAQAEFSTGANVESSELDAAEGANRGTSGKEIEDDGILEAETDAMVRQEEGKLAEVDYLETRLCGLLDVIPELDPEYIPTAPPQGAKGYPGSSKDRSDSSPRNTVEADKSVSPAQDEKASGDPPTTATWDRIVSIVDEASVPADTIKTDSVPPPQQPSGAEPVVEKSETLQVVTQSLKELDSTDASASASHGSMPSVGPPRSLGFGFELFASSVKKVERAQRKEQSQADAEDVIKRPAMKLDDVMAKVPSHDDQVSGPPALGAQKGPSPNTLPSNASGAKEADLPEASQGRRRLAAIRISRLFRSFGKRKEERKSPPTQTEQESVALERKALQAQNQDAIGALLENSGNEQKDDTDTMSLADAVLLLTESFKKLDDGRSNQESKQDLNETPNEPVSDTDGGDKSGTDADSYASKAVNAKSPSMLDSVADLLFDESGLAPSSPNAQDAVKRWFSVMERSEHCVESLMKLGIVQPGTAVRTENGACALCGRKGGCEGRVIKEVIKSLRPDMVGSDGELRAPQKTKKLNDHTQDPFEAVFWCCWDF